VDPGVGPQRDEGQARDEGADADRRGQGRDAERLEIDEEREATQERPERGQRQPAGAACVVEVLEGDVSVGSSADLGHCCDSCQLTAVVWRSSGVTRRM